MKRRSMFTVGKNKGVASSVHRKPLQHMVQRRLRELKKIVPDAHEDNVDVLLRQTAEYICILELKVAVLRKLAAIYGA
uniref:BHLH domain-containing protein n=1 Tax=Oryza barthii TaxID=65489 RepID=A0A0D3H728_9ORYZ